MIEAIPEMIDAVFDVSGERLPANSSFALWNALLQHIPAIETQTCVGVIAPRTVASIDGMLLPKRAKLVLRLPFTHQPLYTALSGQQLELDSGTLTLGSGKLRALQAYPTLHAHLVVSDADELTFLAEAAKQLKELGINGKLLCGMRNSTAISYRTLQGYSLVVHDLKPDDSIRLQYTGLGAERRFGCGIFVPYKAITDLD